MARDPRIERIIEQILETQCTPEEACVECPELLHEVRRSLHWVRSVEERVNAIFPPSGSPEASIARDLAIKLPEIPGYAVEAVLGRGGVGVVYKAHDLKLDRPVAIKMLLSGSFASPSELIRFKREAQAVAALSHPNFVQVYEVGELEGRPYYTMEFIEGGNLAQQLAGTPQPASQAATMIVVLAEAIHMAHERGIVHRDLKPGNILLTSRRVPKISDFGLAWYSGREGSLTLSGIPIGTPSYMAPEQATGKKMEIGPPADIYSLGAILYEMLTGRPPFRAENYLETERQLLNEEPVPPSRLNVKVPRDLQTICLKCLSKNPARRYPTALALAEDIQRFGRNEPITARPTGWIERSIKWVRRHPGFTAVTIGSIVIAFILTGGALWYFTNRAATFRAAEMDLHEVEEAENRSDWVVAAAALDRAKVRTHDRSMQSVRELLDQDERDLEFGQRLESIGLNRMALVESRFKRPFDNVQADAAYSREFRDGGMGNFSDDPVSVAERIGRSKVRGALIAALDDWAICVTDANRHRWIFEVARAADPDPTGWRDRARDPLIINSRPALSQLAESDSAMNQPVRLLAALGERLEDAGASAEAITFLKRVQTKYPNDFWANFTLGDALRKSGDLSESERYFQAAIAVRPQSTVAIGNLGMALAADNRTEEAADQFRQELVIDPQSAHAHYSLGLALRKMGRVDEAIPEFKESVRLEPDIANHQYNLALALVDKGEPDQAVQYFHNALTMDPSYADAHYNYGILLMTKDNNEAAIEQFQDAIKLNPDNANAHYCLGLAYRKLGRVDDAIAELGESVRQDATVATHQYNLALALVDKGKLDQAVDHFHVAIKMAPDFVDARNNLGVVMMIEGKNSEAIEQFQQVLKINPNDSHAHYNLGLELKGAGQLDAAVEHLQKAVELDPSDLYAHYNLGLGLMAQSKKDLAIPQFDAAIKMDPKQPDVHYNLALALMESGRLDEAIQHYRQAIALQPANGYSYGGLGNALMGQGRVQEAQIAFEHCLSLLPQNDPWRQQYVDQLRRCHVLLGGTGR